LNVSAPYAAAVGGSDTAQSHGDIESQVHENTDWINEHGRSAADWVEKNSWLDNHEHAQITVEPVKDTPAVDMNTSEGTSDATTSDGSSDNQKTEAVDTKPDDDSQSTDADQTAGGNENPTVDSKNPLLARRSNFRF